MNLRYKLPPWAKALLSPADGEKIEYCAPADLTGDGRMTGDAYTVVTDARLVVLDRSGVKHDCKLADLSEVRCEPQVDCGLLLAVLRGEPVLLARFSMKHTVRYSYIARAADGMAKNRPVTLKIRETEAVCKLCGQPLPRMGMCKNCGSKKIAFGRFLTLLRPYLLRLALVSLLMLLSGGLLLFSQYLQRVLADRYLVPGRAEPAGLALIFGGMAFMIAAVIVLNIVQNLYCVRLGARISLDLREKLYKKLQELSLSFITTRQPGELMNRIVQDTSQIRRFMEEAFSQMFSTFVTMLGALVVMLAISPSLTLLSLVFVPAVIVLSRLWRTRIHRMFHAQWKKTDRLSSSLQDVLSGIRVVKAFGREGEEISKFKRAADGLGSTQRRNELFWATFYPFLTFVMGLGSYFVVLFGGLQVLSADMSIGELMQFSSSAAILYGPLSWMARFPRMLIQMLASLSRIYDVLDEEPEIQNSEAAKAFDIKGDIEFENIRFGYRCYEPVLKDLSFQVKAGEMIGLVGPSGAGKSTVINLLMRLYDVDEGRILIDGVDVRDIDIRALHSQIGVVLQETFLFSGTIFDNIRFSKPDATREEIILAAKRANAHDFICRFPDGYNSYVGERGVMLSGGERQRISIARAILGDPKILILDEATSSLDTESEHEVQRALERLTQGRTTFAIAHRLSTLKNASRLFVIDDHGMAESGTHDELMNRKGIYYGLVQAQLEMHKVREFSELERQAAKEITFEKKPQKA